ncbi:hypothetical protein ACIB24_16255 [Spongisporangium articulatum]|uniref:FG-GAP repeat-containing protein n=1 Tax=Spongisporangium articulatum TaxID=3362603 RepID=A0ABW8AQI6_9ACTN
MQRHLVRQRCRRGSLVAAATIGLTTIAAGQAVAFDRITAVGLPGIGGGEVHTREQGGFRQTLTRAAFPGLQQRSNTAFGAAVAIGDLDGNGEMDVAVGDPNTSASGQDGEVDLFFQENARFPATSFQVVRPDGTAHDRFGAAVALSRRGDEYGPVTDLWVGAPGTDVDGVPDAGAVYHYIVTQVENDQPTVVLAQTLTQDTTEVGGVLEPDDRFGSVLAPATSGVVVGVPDEDIGTATDAGAMQRIRIDPDTGDLLTGQIFNQDIKGVPGKAEAGDRFGAAVSEDGLLVGIPGEDVTAPDGSTLENAGAVQTFTANNGLSNMLKPLHYRTQDSPDQPGKAEAGDQFGAAVATGIYDCDEVTLAAVGAPGEDLGSRTNAGAVTLFRAGDGGPPCSTRMLWQGHGLTGRAEPGDRTGATLGTMNGDPEAEENRHDLLAVGVPGEDIEAKGVVDTGRVMTWYLETSSAYGLPDGTGDDEPGARYGTVLGLETS